MRKPFQGVLNIIRFNWHFYVISFAIVLLMLFTASHLSESLQLFIYIGCILIFCTNIISLLASFYIYDISGLYGLNWINQNNAETLIVNINAGFDEISALLKRKFSKAELIALDFYDPQKHTEISIKRARRAYPPFPTTSQIKTGNVNLADNVADKIFVILSAHEIRSENERILFFNELRSIIKPTGEIYVTEHLRDFSNFLVYNIGFFHFYSKSSWICVFNNANLDVKQEIKITPFISTFILKKNGNTL